MMAACGSKPEDPQHIDTDPPLYPDIAGVTIPADCAPLNFNLVDDKYRRVDAVIRGESGGEVHANGSWADFDVKEWHDLLAQNIGARLSLTVAAQTDDGWVQFRDVNIFVSADSIGDWGLTYRRIAPGYEVYGQMGIYQRCLANFDETPIFENTRVPGSCVNCHTANATRPSSFTFHVRGDHGATLLSHRGKVEILKARNDSIKGSLVYPYWHPQNEFVAYSTNQTHQSFHALKDERIEVFDQASDVLIYHPASHSILRDSLVATPDHYENYPVFSPDGLTLYFCSSVAWDIPAHYKDIQYNICRVGFDPATGVFTGQVDTLFNARMMGKSANHPRPSYDGRYLLFTLSDYGCFPIWHKEADQWLLDLQTGEARAIDEINSPDADSFHNWSSNSRWVVFTSRRENGLYTQLFLTHVDDKGRFSKPFLLPQRNPKEYYGETLYSFNTPDFTKTKVEFDSRSAAREILSDQRVPTKVK